MKILYTNHHDGPGIGGHVVYIGRLAEALSQRHEVFVASPPDSALIDLCSQWPGVTGFEQTFPNRVPSIPAAAKRLRQFIAEQSFDVIHVNGSSDHRLVLLACLGLRRPPVVLTKHNDKKMKYVGAKLRSTLGTEHVIAVCEYVVQQLNETPYRSLPISVIPNGVDTDHFSPWSPEASLKARVNIFGDDPDIKLVLGSNAGTDDYKGWLDLVDAVGGLPPEVRRGIRIVIAGEAPSNRAMDKIAENGLNDQFVYMGMLRDVRDLIAAIDVGFVLSWKTETISFACREMMAMGKPVVVTNHAGLPENVDHGVDGWIVPPRSVEQLRELLSAILAGEHALAAMGESARQKSRLSFGIDDFLNNTEKVYLSLLPQRPIV